MGNFLLTTGGQAMVNESFHHLVEEAGAEAHIVDLSPVRTTIAILSRISRAPRAAVGLLKLAILLLTRPIRSIYIGVSGGYGQLYDLPFVAVARLLRLVIVLHHDSFAYLETRSLVTAGLVRIAGSAATHVVLCEAMGARLRKLYPTATAVVVVPNATNATDTSTKPIVRGRLRSIGLLSNLTVAKGTLEFLAIADQVHQLWPDLRIVLAGPVIDQQVKQAVQVRARADGSIQYLGPVYGADRLRFYEDVDVFVFPTRYVNEADPRVVSEALAHGSIVIARGRGCIPQTVAGAGAFVISESEDFVSGTLAVLEDLRGNSERVVNLSMRSSAAIAELRAKSQETLRLVIARLVGS